MNILFVRKVLVEDAHHINAEIQLVKALNKRGHNAKLLGIGRKNRFEKELILLKFSFNMGRIFLLKLFFFLPFYCVIKKIDVLFVDSEIVPAAFLILAIKRIFPIKIFLDVRSIPVEQELPKQYKYACTTAAKYFDGATFITSGTKNYIEKLINRKFINYKIFPSAVNPSIFSPAVSDGISPELKERIKNKFVIFYHGSISPNRGINLILDAIEQIKNIIPDIIFISLSGGNNYILDYCKLNEYSLEDNLILLDTVEYEKVPAYIKLADLCVVPLPKLLWWEISSPLKLMEYLSMGKPVLLSDIEAHHSVVQEDLGFSYFFEPDKRGKLSQVIIKAINNLDLLKQNAVKGRELILNKFTWDIQAKVVEEFAAGN